VVVSSPHLTIASLLNVRADFVAPNRNATIVSIQGIINQQFTISYDDPDVVSSPPVERHVLAKVGKKAQPAPWSQPNATHAATTRPPASSAGASSPAASFASCPGSGSGSRSGSGSDAGSSRSSPGPPSCVIKSKYKGVSGEVVIGDEVPLARVGPGHEFAYSRVMRVPDDDFVRSTTLEGSDGRIRVAHTLAVEIRYKIDGDDEGDKIIRLAKKLTIASVSLPPSPPYHRPAPGPVRLDPTRG